MPYCVDGIEEEKLLGIFRKFADYLGNDLAEVVPEGQGYYKVALAEMIKDGSTTFEYLADDIASAARETVDKEADRLTVENEEQAKEIEELKANPIVSIPSFGPEGLKWNQREQAFVCTITGNRFYVVPEGLMRQLAEG